MRILPALILSFLVAPALAMPPPCNGGIVFEDSNGNGRLDAGEPGLPGIKVSDGVAISTTDGTRSYQLRWEEGRTTFVIKPAGYRLAKDGLPDFWRHVRRRPGPALKRGGIPTGSVDCRNFALLPDRAAAQASASGDLDVLVFADPQTKSKTDVGYYERDIIATVLDSKHAVSDLGISLGDIVHDDLSLYPALNRATTKLGVPWLHVAGNHDLDFDAERDEDSLLTFRNTFGPDTFAWEEDQAVFVLLDDVIYQPGSKPSYSSWEMPLLKLREPGPSPSSRP